MGSVAGVAAATRVVEAPLGAVAAAAAEAAARTTAGEAPLAAIAA